MSGFEDAFGAPGASKERNQANYDRQQGEQLQMQDSFYDKKSSQALREDLDRRMAAIAARQAPTMQKAVYGSSAYGTASKVGPLAMVGDEKIARNDLAARGNQQAALSQFAQQANGQGPTVARAQMQQSADAALAAYARTRAASRNRPGGTTAANAQMGGVLHEGSLNSAGSRARESMDGAQRFAGLSDQMRGADLGAAMAQARMDHEAGFTNANARNAAGLANAGFAQQMGQFNAGTSQKQADLYQQANLANLGNAVQMQGLNDAASSSFLDMYGRQTNLDNDAEKSFWELQQDIRNTDRSGEYARQQADKQATAQTMSAAAQMMAKSDRRAKKNIKPGGDAVGAMLDELKSYSYEYKDPDLDGAAPGKHTSVMAQDLAKTELGKSAVKEGADGVLRVDYGRLAGVQLAALVEQRKEIKELKALAAKGGK